jgi:predicted signal transduction protein with EAL and GGDEF domain
MIGKILSKPLKGVVILSISFFVSFVFLTIDLKKEVDKDIEIERSSDKIIIFKSVWEKDIVSAIRSKDIISSIAELRDLFVESHYVDELTYEYIKSKIKKQMDMNPLIHDISIESNNKKTIISHKYKNYEKDNVDYISKSFPLDNGTFLRLIKHSITNFLSVEIVSPIFNNVDNQMLVVGRITVDIVFDEKFVRSNIKGEQNLIVLSKDNIAVKVIGNIEEQSVDKYVNAYNKNKEYVLKNSYPIGVSLRKSFVLEDSMVVINGIDIFNSVSLIYTSPYYNKPIKFNSPYIIISLLVFSLLLVIITFCYKSFYYVDKKTGELIITKIDRIINKNNDLLAKESWLSETGFKLLLKINELGKKINEERNINNVLANINQSTGLINRRAGIEYHKEIINSAILDGLNLSNFYIYIDSQISDELKIKYGKKAMSMIGDRIDKIAHRIVFDNPGSKFLLYQVTEDEFNLVITNTSDEKEINEIGEKIISAVREPVFVNKHWFNFSAAIGTTSLPMDGTTINELNGNTNVALIESRKNGFNNIVIYNNEIREKNEQSNLLKNELENALQNKEFSILYQPEISTKGKRLIGAEAAIRWSNPLFGEVSPNIFIPIAKEMGLLNDIGLWAIKEACEQNMAWQKEGYKKILMSVNIEANLLLSHCFIDKLDTIIKDSGLSPEFLALEIKLFNLSGNYKGILDPLKIISKLGVKIILDNFGSGKYSINSAVKLPLDAIKVNYSVLTHENKISHEDILKSISYFARAIDTKVIIKGINTIELAEIVSNSGYSSMQGSIFSKAKPPHGFVKNFTANFNHYFTGEKVLGIDTSKK